MDIYIDNILSNIKISTSDKELIKDYFSRIKKDYQDYLEYKIDEVDFNINFVKSKKHIFDKILKTPISYDYDISILLKQFLYKGGVIPEYENLSLFYHTGRYQLIELNGQNFEYSYFLWVNELEPKANLDEIITKENFFKYKRPIFDYGWTKGQLITFVRVNIVPFVLQKYNINLNINNPSYIKCLTNLAKYKLNDMIKSYIYEEEEELNIKYLANCLILKQRKIQKSITEKIKRITNNKSDKNKKRYKWENLCNILNKINIYDLYELAAIERIPYYSSMTRRELCAELSKLAAERMIIKGKLEHKCINTDSISGDSIKDIPAEFFISFYDNNKLFCEDIRSLYTIVQHNSRPKNPWNGVPFKESIIELIIKEYEILTETVNTFDDFNQEKEILSNTSLLSSKTTDFISLLNYPNPASYFINASRDKVNEFINELNKEFVLDSRDNRILQNESDSTIKLTLLNILINIIKNDRNQIETPSGMLSSMAINISIVYNEIFKA